VADGRRRGNSRCRSRSTHGPDWISSRHNRNFRNCNWDGTGYDNSWIDADARNYPAWDSNTDPWNRKSNARNGNTCPRNNTRDNSDKSNAGNESGNDYSGNQSNYSDSRDHAGHYQSGIYDSGNNASGGWHNPGNNESAKHHTSDYTTDHHTWNDDSTASLVTKLRNSEGQLRLASFFCP
jgi:hypothetical protein